jgi:two-component system, NarL family, sensor histidine kinase YdfH
MEAMKKILSLTAANDLSVTEVPFFVFLTLILGGFSIFAIFTSPALNQNPLTLALFCVLMLAHIAGYWVSPRFAASTRSIVIYLLVQYLAAFVIGLIARSNSLTIGDFMALVGITAGLLKLSPWGIAGIATVLALSLVSFGIQEGWASALQWSIYSIPSAVFTILYVILYMRQVEARGQAQELAKELEAANRHLAAYAAQVEDLTLANERQRMARELHDTLSQGLAGVILKLEAADAHLQNSRPERARAILEGTMTQARATLSDARRAIDDLRLGSAQSASLRDALRAEVSRFSEATALPCELEIDLEKEIPSSLREPVVRTVSEALTNVARHARASHVQVCLTSQGGSLEVCVQDDGTGFDPQSAAGQSGHYGLLGMRERARLAGGSLEIKSQPGAGARVCLSLPLKEQEKTA